MRVDGRRERLCGFLFVGRARWDGLRRHWGESDARVQTAGWVITRGGLWVDGWMYLYLGTYMYIYVCVYVVWMRERTSASLWGGAFRYLSGACRDAGVAHERGARHLGCPWAIQGLRELGRQWFRAGSRLDWWRGGK
jgi:hypothetical protein